MRREANISMVELLSFEVYPLPFYPLSDYTFSMLTLKCELHIKVLFAQPKSTDVLFLHENICYGYSF